MAGSRPYDIKIIEGGGGGAKKNSVVKMYQTISYCVRSVRQSWGLGDALSPPIWGLRAGKFFEIWNLIQAKTVRFFMYSNAFLSTNSAVTTNHIRVKRPKRIVSKETPPWLGNFLNSHPLELLKQPSWKVFVRNLKHHLRRETMKSVYFETLRQTFRETISILKKL